MKEANDEMRRTIRQERSNVLVEVAHLDTKGGLSRKDFSGQPE